MRSSTQHHHRVHHQTTSTHFWSTSRGGDVRGQLALTALLTLHRPFAPKSPVMKSNKISYTFLPCDFSLGLIKAGEDTPSNAAWSSTSRAAHTSLFKGQSVLEEKRLLEFDVSFIKTRLLSLTNVATIFISNLQR